MRRLKYFLICAAILKSEPPYVGTYVFSNRLWLRRSQKGLKSRLQREMRHVIFAATDR